MVGSRPNTSGARLGVPGLLFTLLYFGGPCTGHGRSGTRSLFFEKKKMSGPGTFSKTRPAAVCARVPRRVTTARALNP